MLSTGIFNLVVAIVFGLVRTERYQGWWALAWLLWVGIAIWIIVKAFSTNGRD